MFDVAAAELPRVLLRACPGSTGTWDQTHRVTYRSSLHFRLELTHWRRRQQKALVPRGSPVKWPRHSSNAILLECPVRSRCSGNGGFPGRSASPTSSSSSIGFIFHVQHRYRDRPERLLHSAFRMHYHRPPPAREPLGEWSDHSPSAGETELLDANFTFALFQLLRVFSVSDWFCRVCCQEEWFCCWVKAKSHIYSVSVRTCSSSFCFPRSFSMPGTFSCSPL